MKMTDDDLRILRGYVVTYQNSSVPRVRQLAGRIIDGLSALARRVMLDPGVGRDLVAMLAPIEQSHAPVVGAARAMLAELGEYSISPLELRLLRSGDLFGHVPALAQAVDAALSCIVHGSAISEQQRRELDAYVASECDSVALAVVSLLRAVDARTRETSRG